MLPARRTLVLAGAVACALAFVGPGSSRDGGIYKGRTLAAWVEDALAYERWAETVGARQLLARETPQRAVPLLIKALESECHSDLFYTVLNWQYKLPARLQFSNTPETRGKVASAAWVLSQMGEPARPAGEVLGRTLRHSGMHAWEAQDVMTDLIGMGPVARGALPHLRKMAADTTDWQRAQAAFAIYTITGETNTLVQVVREKLKAQRFEDFERELFWFRSDEELNRFLLPLICQAAREVDTGRRDHEQIVAYLGETTLTNPLPRVTLEAMMRADLDSRLRQEVQQGLDKLNNPDNHGAESATAP